MFCPKCKTLMIVSKENWLCRRCNHTIPITDDETLVVREKKELRETLIINGLVLPKTAVECPRCGNNEAYWQLRQTRAADEPETRIFRCTKCDYTWREY